MNTLTDQELLRDYTGRRSEAAFAELVRRHVDFVYSAALRMVRDAHLAQDVAQGVFVALAQSAPQLTGRPILSGWLHRTTQNLAANTVRSDVRRRAREQEAAAMNELHEPDAVWEDIAPHLDNALGELSEADRDALLLRYFEGKSAREIAQTLGTSEDAAQKRVAGALEQISQYFQRRGFKTATVAAASAALEHTAATASAATVTVVINGVLESAPPALVGLTALLARLGSWSKAQVAALSLAMAALPLGWQWNERRLAAGEAARIEADLDSIRLEQTTLETEMQRLTATSERLPDPLANAAEAEAQNAEAARKMESWKSRIRSVLIADDYRWPEDSPFVRIPKSAARGLSVHMPIGPPGVISPEAREWLGLSAQERVAVEEQLRGYFAEVDRMIEAGIYETNRSSRVRAPASAIANKIFYVPALGETARESGDRLATEMRAVLGEERWPLVESQIHTQGTHTLRRILNLDADHEWQEVSVWISPNDKGVLTVGYQWATERASFSSDGATLASLLSDANPAGGRWAIDDIQRNNLPGAVTTRMLAWLREQAKARLGKNSEP